MLGTGTPRPDPNCAGPATVIMANDTPYLVDFGPGVVRRASAAYEKGVKALGYGGVSIKTAFLTHMHSDHTIGYPDLISITGTTLNQTGQAIEAIGLAMGVYLAISAVLSLAMNLYNGSLLRRGAA